MAVAQPRDGEACDISLYPRASQDVTLADPERIVWSSLRHLCSRDIADSVLAECHGVKSKRDRAALVRNLRVFIEQAIEFYDAASSAARSRLLFTP